MGMFDRVYAELDCPFCGRQYRHTPISWATAERECKQRKAGELELLEESDQPFSRLQAAFMPLRAQEDGFTLREGHEKEDLRAWVEQIDGPESIERWRTRRELGLAEIQTKAFENILESFFVEDEVPSYSGHYYIQESFICEGCSGEDESVWVAVWLEIEARRLKAIRVKNPDTGLPERQTFARKVLPQSEPEHPRLKPEYHDFLATAAWDEAEGVYYGRVVAFKGELTFTGKDAEEVQREFEKAVNEYLLDWAQRAPALNVHTSENEAGQSA